LYTVEFTYPPINGTTKNEPKSTKLDITEDQLGLIIMFRISLRITETKLRPTIGAKLVSVGSVEEL
jgi:hypothetical protein